MLPRSNNHELSVFRRHLLKNSYYRVVITSKEMTLTYQDYKKSYRRSDPKKPPKYLVPLSMNTHIFWKMNAHQKLASIGFIYKGKAKFFESSSENLENMKKSLDKYVIYKNIRMFYEPV